MNQTIGEKWKRVLEKEPDNETAQIIIALIDAGASIRAVNMLHENIQNKRSVPPVLHNIFDSWDSFGVFAALCVDGKLDGQLISVRNFGDSGLSEIKRACSAIIGKSEDATSEVTDTDIESIFLWSIQQSVDARRLLEKFPPIMERAVLTASVNERRRAQIGRDLWKIMKAFDSIEEQIKYIKASPQD